MKKFFFLVALITISLFSSAQDLIKLKSKEVLEGKVLEIGIDEVKYKPANNPDSPVMVVLKSDVREIIYENGSKFLVANDPYDAAPDIEIRRKTHAIKIDFLAPLFNHFTLGYEQMIKVGTNLEVKGGIIGPGFSEQMDHASGGFVKVGVKFLKTSDYYVKGMKLSHGLKGSYIKPEFIFNFYEKTGRHYQYTANGSSFISTNIAYTNYALNLCFGRQTIWGNAVTFDYFVGIGYGGQSRKVKSSSGAVFSDSEYDSYVYTHTVGQGTPIVLSAGMTIGIIF